MHTGGMVSNCILSVSFTEKSSPVRKLFMRMKHIVCEHMAHKYKQRILSAINIYLGKLVTHHRISQLQCGESLGYCSNHCITITSNHLSHALLIWSKTWRSHSERTREYGGRSTTLQYMQVHKALDYVGHMKTCLVMQHTNTCQHA